MLVVLSQPSDGPMTNPYDLSSRGYIVMVMEMRYA